MGQREVLTVHEFSVLSSNVDLGGHLSGGAMLQFDVGAYCFHNGHLYTSVMKSLNHGVCLLNYLATL